MSLRPKLRWLLFASAALAVLGVLWPEQSTALIGATNLGAAAVPVDASVKVGSTPSTPTADAALSEHLPAARLDPSSFDPFVGLQLPPPSLLVQTQPFVLVGPLPPPPAPALNYRYLGQMLDPAGQRVVYLSKDDAAAVPVSAGTQLPEGYVVEAIDDGGVRLYAATFDARAVIPIPPAQDSVPR